MAAKPVEARLTPAARRDLASIWRNGFELWGIEQAHRYAESLAAAFDRLAINPRLGVACDHIRLGYRRFPVGRHLIYFRVTVYGIRVIRVLHGRMDAIRHV